MQVRSGLCVSLMMLFTASGAWAQPRRPLNDPPSRTAGAGVTDDEQARAIEAQVTTDPVLRDDQITIEVSGKRVRLSGSVDTADERTHATDVVRLSNPTLEVENLLQTNDDTTQSPTSTTTTSDKVTTGTKRAARKAEKAANEVGEMVTDGWITSKVKTQLMAAEGVRASGINVDTADHVVILRGQVRSEAERRKAVNIARQTRGVEDVVDELTVVRAKDR